MFLPQSKYQIKHAQAGEFYLSGSEDKGFYVGPYIEDYLGRTFAGTDILTADDKVLIPVTTDEQWPNLTAKQNFLPTEETYTSGSYTRYFRQNRVSRVIEEIDEKQVASTSVRLWRIVSGSWIVTGSLDNRLIYNEIYRGVRVRNQQQLDRWEREMPGITEALGLFPEEFVKES